MRSSKRFFRGSVALFEMIEDKIFLVMSNLYFFQSIKSNTSGLQWCLILQMYSLLALLLPNMENI